MHRPQDLMGPHGVQSLRGKYCHILFFTFPLFFDLIPCSLFWLALDFVMPQHFIMFSLFCYLQPPSLHPLSSILCPPSVLCHFVTPSPSLPSSVTLSSLLSISLSPNSLLYSIFTFATSIHYSLPPRSNFVYLTFHPLWLYESFLLSLYYPVHCTSPSLVVYKSFWLVVIP